MTDKVINAMVQADNSTQVLLDNMPADGSTILDTPEQIELFHLLQMKYALRIEIRTGMRHSRGSVLKLVNETFGWNHRTKQAALDALEEVIAEKTKHLTEDPA